MEMTTKERGKMTRLEQLLKAGARLRWADKQCYNGHADANKKRILSYKYWIKSILRFQLDRP
jgi:D-serine deaminase-like pyridoxal phosphate-dependent protein